MPTNPEKDYYAILGVMPDAQDIVIKAAYRALAQRYHPDRFGGSREAAHSDANPARVVPKIARDFDVRHLSIDKQKIASLLAQAKKSAAHTGLFTQMLGELGGTFAVNGGHSAVRRASVGKSCRVEFEGRDFQFPSEGEFRSWFRREVLPMAEQWSRQERVAPGRQAEAR